MIRKQPKQAGVYLLKHDPTGYVYIGATRDLRSRKSLHFSQLRQGIHHAFKKVVSDQEESRFSWTVLEVVDDPSDASINDAERKWMSHWYVKDKNLLINNPTHSYRTPQSPGRPDLHFNSTYTVLREFCIINGLCLFRSFHEAVQDFIEKQQPRPKPGPKAKAAP